MSCNSALLRICLFTGLLLCSAGANALSKITLKAASAQIHAADVQHSLNKISFDLRFAEDRSSVFSVTAANYAFASDDGSTLGENLKPTVTGKLVNDANASLRVSGMKGKIAQGEMLTPYAYASFSERPLTLNITNLLINKGVRRIQHAVLNDGVVSIDVQDMIVDEHAGLSMQSIVRLDSLSKVYQSNLLPVITSPLAMAEVSGKASLMFSLSGSSLQAYQLSLQAVDLKHDNPGAPAKYLLSGLNGNLAWTTENHAESYLEFDSASFFERIQLGKTIMPLKTGNRSIGIRDTVEMPVFDGSLLLETFELSHSGKSVDVDFQGILTPVSLSALTQALGWPEMQGRISGVIPAIRYRDGNAELAGTMLVKVFDGDVLVRDVQASHLLSSWPLLSANVQIRKLDLEPLTRTFSFGLITGLLNGRIDNLVLENWAPTAFDAHFETDPDSPRNRISQKAVDNISNLGGSGVAGALSRSFLRFFEDFGYDRLGINCVLQQGVCQMSGVENAEQGYYLVKGKGIPRIDVIGFNDSIDWVVLVDRLTAISESGAPTIQ
jgi:hypothetical protein